MIPNFPIGDLLIDCANAQRALDFYAGLTGWEKTAILGCPALQTPYGMRLLFVQTDFPYAPPVWPEVPGAQQKQMHLDFTVDDCPSALEKALRLGATRPAAQYGGEHFVTLLDTEGHPFCLCGRPQSKSEFDLYFEKMGYGAIPDLSVNIDCRKSEELRAFYARLTDWDQGFHGTALLPANRMVVHFMGCDGDFDYTPPVWPEQPGAQQKQLRFLYQVDDLSFAVGEALRVGAIQAEVQEDEGRFVTLFDPQGHPFCLCAKE